MLNAIEKVSTLVLDEHQCRIVFYRAVLDLNSVCFEAFGPTEEDARFFLLEGLNNSEEEAEDLGKGWYHAYLDYIEVQQVCYGDCIKINKDF